jgi:hypothetical protein
MKPTKNLTNSEYLIPCAEKSPAGVDIPQPFPHGHFACKVVKEHFFTVNERITPDVALNAITVVLQPFGITNRPCMFVYSWKAVNGTLDVFYLGFRFRVVTLPQSESGSTLETRKSRVLMQIHGLSEPQPEMIHELVASVQAKLDSVAVTLLGTYIARNPAKKLIAGDVDMLLPLKRAPTREHTIHLSACNEPSDFMEMVRVNIPAIFVPLKGITSGVIDSYISSELPKALVVR